jgi:hypothetical protein
MLPVSLIIYFNYGYGNYVCWLAYGIDAYKGSDRQCYEQPHKPRQAPKEGLAFNLLFSLCFGQCFALFVLLVRFKLSD